MHYVTAKGILLPSNGMNLYRGCSHGCIYCDSRSKCYHMEHEFEDIEVKGNALSLLEAALRSKRTKCMLATGSMTDPYLPLEEELGLVRGALTLADRYGFGFTLITKSARVLRDIALLQSINEHTKSVVQMTLTTWDETLCKQIEPNVSTTRQRLDALARLRDAGIPTVVWLSPILPFLNDTQENICALVDACAQVGVRGILCFGMGLTLREGNREYFFRQLDRLFPGLKEAYLRTYGLRYELLSPRNDALMELFHRRCEMHGILHSNRQIFEELRRFEQKDAPVQLSLFGDDDSTGQADAPEGAPPQSLPCIKGGGTAKP